MSVEALIVTPAAARAAREILDKSETPAGIVRVGVRGGGCSGMEYVVRVDAASREDDLVVEQDGVRFCVDPKSLPYLQGLTLGYEKTLMRYGFTFDNPQAKKSCSCGTSFLVE